MPTPIPSRLLRTGDTYLLDEADLAGGYRTVATLAARDAIPLSARRLGMTVYCQADKTEYQLITSVANTGWGQRPLFSGKVHSVAQIVNVAALQQFNPYVFEQYANARVRQWFNALAPANRVLNKPLYFFKILCAVGAPSLAQGSILPPDTQYLGDATFVYDSAGSSEAVTLVESSIICVAKTLIPLGDQVIAAMDEYAERMAAQ
uniref:Tail fiber protein n=1 Tax=Pseudomonas phage HRDY3 TaxID=3236930 RepID=A0AB39CDZ8_9VIRU